MSLQQAIAFLFATVAFQQCQAAPQEVACGGPPALDQFLRLVRQTTTDDESADIAAIPFYDACFLHDMNGDCKPGKNDLHDFYCINGCACCAQHCARNEKCAGFTYEENSKSTDCRAEYGICRLKSQACKSGELTASQGVEWFQKASLSESEKKGTTNCKKPKDVVLSKSG